MLSAYRLIIFLPSLGLVLLALAILLDRFKLMAELAVYTFLVWLIVVLAQLVSNE